VKGRTLKFLTSLSSIRTSACLTALSRSKICFQEDSSEKTHFWKGPNYIIYTIRWLESPRHTMITPLEDQSGSSIPILRPPAFPGRPPSAAKVPHVRTATAPLLRPIYRLLDVPTYPPPPSPPTRAHRRSPPRLAPLLASKSPAQASRFLAGRAEWPQSHRRPRSLGESPSAADFPSVLLWISTRDGRVARGNVVRGRGGKFAWGITICSWVYATVF
jgi:hypothetical protein